MLVALVLCFCDRAFADDPDFVPKIIVFRNDGESVLARVIPDARVCRTTHSYELDMGATGELSREMFDKSGA